MPYTIDEIIKYCTVRLRSYDESEQAIGSGVLLRQEKWHDKIYLLTAAHCLREETTGNIIRSIRVEVLNPNTETYEPIVIESVVSDSVLMEDDGQDVAVFQLKKESVLAISPNLPSIAITHTHANCKIHTCAGFPSGNRFEYDQLVAAWIGGDMAKHSLSYTTGQTYIESKASGLSGGGIFAITRGEVLLEGVMTKYRKIENGGQLFGSNFQHINNRLYEAHKPILHISYVVAEGVTEHRIREVLNDTYKNLGKRFIPNFNVDTSIQDKLEAISRTPKYYEQVEAKINNWLNDGAYLSMDGKIAEEVKSLQADVLKYAKGIKSYDTIDMSPYEKHAEEIKRLLESEEANAAIAYAPGSKVTEANRKEQLFRIRQYMMSCQSLSGMIEERLTNSNFIVIHGEAGCGKSHLLGHFSQEVLDYNAQRYTKHDCPVLLLLGGNFATGKEIEENIVSQLDAECSFEELLVGLEHIGKSLRRRVPIMIDALNETNGMKYWMDKLPGFVERISKHRYLSLIVTIRDTYLNDVLSESHQEEWNHNMFQHDGFTDGEFNAVQSFCAYYGLNTLKIPILNPEFSNPLYLHIACQIAKDAHMDTLPTGWQVYELFDQYAEKLDKDFAKENSIYKNKHIVSKAIDVIVKRMCDKQQLYMPYDEYDALLEEAFHHRYPNLSNELLESSLLSKGMGYYHGEDVYFTYQRMGDYYVANKLLEGCVTQEDAKERLAVYATSLLEKIVFQGVLEQLYVIVPARFGAEIWELMDISREYHCTGMLLRSLHWRSAGNIHVEAIIDFLHKNRCDVDNWYNTLLFLAPIPAHPFNGEWWHRIWKRYKTMADRDARLQPFILETIRYSKENNIQRLIDWAWTPGVSKEVSEDVAQLTGITLTWILSSTIHSVRNETTKALVNLLQHQPQALLKVLEAFADIDDAYIQERLMAVTYGCVLRCNDKEKICEIGRYVYKQIFAKGDVPKHILLRDYACNIVDYAHRVCGLKGVNMSKVLPPYGAEMPELPDERDVAKYKLDREDKSIRYSWQQNAISRSLYDGLSDFGNKIVATGVHSFFQWSMVEENELQKMIRRSTKEQKLLYQIFIEASTQKQQLLSRYEAEDVKGEVQMRDMMIDLSRKGLETFLSEETIDRLEHVLVPNHAMVGSSMYYNRRNPRPYQYWVVQRVFELGYNKDKHGPYDEDAQRMENSYFRQRDSKGRIERIGKKYQWIAYYELMGYMADNYPIEDPWETTRAIPYDGAWQDLLRNLDPVCITKRDKEVETWTEYELRDDWNLPISRWLADAWTLDEVRQMLVRTDKAGKQWFTMYDWRSIFCPPELGGNPYHNKSFNNYWINAYVIRKEDKERFVKMSGVENFWDYEMANPVESSLHYIAREKFWSRACKIDEAQTSQVWTKFHNQSELEVIVPYVALRGISEDDCKATDAWYALPIQTFFEGMHMEYGDADGDCQIDGEMCATCNPNRTKQFLMQRDMLLTYLEEQGWDIIWTIEQERCFSPEFATHMNMKVWHHSGLFYLDENGELQGSFKIKDRDEGEDTSNTDE